MSKGNWTEEQWSAITARGSNLLVAAAAGAGKTAVLVERVFLRISSEEDPVDVDRLLVVTFTNAAAAEMRERIGTALLQALNANPGSRHLERQLSLLNRAPITTLHAFCLELVRQHFYRLDLDPNFRIADDTEAVLLRLEVLEELLETYYEKEDPDFLRLVECYGGERDDAALQDLILRLDTFARSQPWPKQWLEQAAVSFRLPGEISPDELPWIRNLKESIFLELEKAESLLRRALVISRQPGGPAPYEANLEEDLARIQELKAACCLPWKELGAVFRGFKFNTLKRCRNDVDENLKKQAQAFRDEAKKLTVQLRDAYFLREPEDWFQDFSELEPLVKMLCRLTAEFQEAYRQAKLKRCLVDFSDLEHFSLELLMEPESGPGNLIPSAIAAELRERFVEVLVDEYQDINSIQDTILQLVSRQGSTWPNLFMVGDVKQSIYRFRLAEPGLFLHKYKSYASEPGTLERRIDLSKNFRSRREVVDGTNFIFRQIMTERFGEMAYDAKAELVYGADYPPVEGQWPAELHLIDRKTPEPPAEETGEEKDISAEHESDVEELGATQLEARLIGRRIQELLAGKNGSPFLVFDRGMKSYRPVTYRDIVVLLRATKNGANVFLEEFRQLGIPAHAELGTGYLAAAEVETLLALLKVIDNPLQDIPLAAVLRSPLVGLSAQELAYIRLCSIQGDFYKAVKCKAREKDELGLRLKSFLERLNRWRTLARRNTLADLIWTIYRETGYYDYVGGMPGGAQRQANLRALHDRARQYEKTTYRGLFRFLRFIERLQDSGSDLGAARALGENENVVRIMSIHKSKGLEFPVVFLAGLGKRFNLLDLNKEMLLHQELGIGPALVRPEERLVYPTLAKLAIKHRLKLEMLAEEMRVLYVAMTRAREKLIMVGTVPDLAKASGTWVQHAFTRGWPLAEASLAAAKCFLDWICPALARHPAGLPLSKTAGAEVDLQPEIVADPSVWEIKLWDKNSLQGEQLTPAREDALWEKVRRFEPVEVEEVKAPFLRDRLSWRYPYSQFAGVTAKLAVSEVKERFAHLDREGRVSVYQPPVLERPRFLQESKGLSAAERGSALHLVMQHLDLQHQLDSDQLIMLLAELEVEEILTAEQKAAVDVGKIREFLESPLGVRMRKAAKIYKEMPFSLMLPAHEIYPELEKSDEQVLIQGVIDCLLDEGDGFVLIDYKTDQVEEGRIDKLVQTYRGQLYLYARAVETILRRPVKEKFLYLFEAGKAVKV